MPVRELLTVPHAPHRVAYRQTVQYLDGVQHLRVYVRTGCGKCVYLCEELLSSNGIRQLLRGPASTLVEHAVFKQCHAPNNKPKIPAVIVRRVAKGWQRRLRE